MPKTSSKLDFRFHKAVQISESHCGPAVLQMLLGNIGIDVTQEAITHAAGITNTIEKNGTRIDHMVHAIEHLNIRAKLWYKTHAELADIALLLDHYRYPVGVEWQGLFGEDALEDGMNGHYSIATRVDTVHNALIIVDPYKDFAQQDRIIPITTFLKRWWDENEATDPSGKPYEIRDDQLLFIVTPPSIVFPPALQLVAGTEYNS